MKIVKKNTKTLTRLQRRKKQRTRTWIRETGWNVGLGQKKWGIK